MNATKKLFTTLFLLTLAFIVCDRVLGKLVSSGLRRSNVAISQVYQGNKNFDVLLLGSSRGEKSFIPKIFHKYGINAFQLSYQGLSTEVCTALFKDYIQTNRPPKKVLLEVSSLELGSDSVFGIKSYAYFSENLTRLLSAQIRNYEIFSTISKLYVLNSDFLLRALYFFNKSDQDKITYYRRRITVEYSLERLEKLPDYSPSIKVNNLNSLSELSDICSKLGVDLILFYPPINPYYYEKEQHQIEKLIAQSQDFTPYKIHDFSNFTDDVNDFADLSHMNYYGAKAFTEYCINTFF